MKTPLLHRLHPDGDRRLTDGLLGPEMSLSDVVATIDHLPSSPAFPTIDFLQREIRRVGASEGELRRAMSLIASEASLEPRAYAALSKRMRRLVDLLELANPAARAQLWPADVGPSVRAGTGYSGAMVVPLRRAGSAAR